MRIILTAMACIACLAFGLYAGKRRERGMGWLAIAIDMMKGVFSAAAETLKWAYGPFRKERHDQSAEADNGDNEADAEGK